MLNKLKNKLWQGKTKLLTVELLSPEHFTDEDGDGYYWAAVPNDDFLCEIKADFPEADQIYCEFYVPLRESKEEIRVLVSETKNFPMNAPVVSEDGKHFHFATARGMELQWKLQIPHNDTASHILVLGKVDRGVYKINRMYRNLHD